MFCKYCGAQMAEDAAFCPKCGKANATPPVQNAPTNNQPKRASGINLKILIPLAAIIVVLLGVIVAKVIGNNKSSTGLMAAENMMVSGTEECSGCAEAATCYDALMDSANAYGLDINELAANTTQYYNAMHHDCSSDITNVENVPFVYRGCLGTYTGEWKGAGPFGTGKFEGITKYKNNAISYEGDWAYGLPEGVGNLYIQDFADSSWDMIYSGDMKAGNREGTGYICEYNAGGSYNPMYRVYDAATFQNDIMTSVVDCTQYDSKTGELMCYNRVTGDNSSGWVIELDHWEANELNPEQRQTLELAECALVVGTVGYMAKSFYDGMTYDYDAHVDKEQQILSELDAIRYKLTDNAPLY